VAFALHPALASLADTTAEKTGIPMSTIARVFVSQAEAKTARVALVEAEINTNDIEVTFEGDEAGPVRGNFLTGDSKQSIGM
jgi:hypothetical protein